VCAAFCVRARACLVMVIDEDQLLPHFRGVFVQNTLYVSMFSKSYDLLLHIYLLVLLLFLYDDTCIILNQFAILNRPTSFSMEAPPIPPPASLFTRTSKSPIFFLSLEVSFAEAPW
jgi:hypothetical protein